MSTPAAKTPVFCADCGHRSNLHYPNNRHRCALDDCPCQRFVSPAEAQEVAKALKAQLEESGVLQ